MCLARNSRLIEALFNSRLIEGWFKPMHPHLVGRPAIELLESCPLASPTREEAVPHLGAGVPSGSGQDDFVR
jgi:hypothetical protein